MATVVIQYNHISNKFGLWRKLHVEMKVSSRLHELIVRYNFKEKCKTHHWFCRQLWVGHGEAIENPACNGKKMQQLNRGWGGDSGNTGEKGKWWVDKGKHTSNGIGGKTRLLLIPALGKLPHKTSTTQQQMHWQHNNQTDEEDKRVLGVNRVKG